MAAGTAALRTNKSLMLGDDAGTLRHLGIQAGGGVSTQQYHASAVTRDVAANDSSKIITVPASRLWLISWILVDYTCTATAGTRTLVLDFRNAADAVIAQATSPQAMAANDHRANMFIPGGFRTNSNDNEIIFGSLPDPMILEAGFDIFIRDSAAIAAAADDMLISIGHQEFTV